jgi:beta-glucosidase
MFSANIFVTQTLVVGPNAKFAAFSGGGSASLLPYYAVSPFEGVSKKVSGKVSYCIGCHAHKELPLLGPQVKTAAGRTGFMFKVYNEDHSVSKREAIDSLTIVDSNMFLADYTNPKLESNFWYAEIEGDLIADDDGDYEFGVSVYGTAKLFVDDKLVVDNETNQVQGTTFFGSGSIEEKGIISVKKGQKYHIRVDFGSGATSKLRTDGVVVFGGGLRLGGCHTIDKHEATAHACSLAKEADQVIICAGLNVSIHVSTLKLIFTFRRPTGKEKE